MKIKKFLSVIVSAALCAAPAVMPLSAKTASTEQTAQAESDTAAQADAGTDTADQNSKVQNANTDAGSENADANTDTASDSQNSQSAESSKSSKNTAKKNKGSAVDCTQKYAIIALIAGVVFAVVRIVMGLKNQE